MVSASYRLAPEDPFPAGVDDGVAVARWLLDNGGKAVAEGGFGSRRIIVGGESAGGYLAAAVLLRIRDELGAIDRVAGANLVYGIYDWRRSPSHLGLRPTDGPDLLSPDGFTFFTDAYLPGRTDAERRDPAVSPAFADLHGLPPALLSVGTNDHLMDDTLLLASRWSAAGGDVDLFVGPDLPHGFNAFSLCTHPALGAAQRRMVRPRARPGSQLGSQILLGEAWCQPGPGRAQLALSHSAGWPVTLAMRSKSLSQRSTVSPASSAVAVMIKSGTEGARCCPRSIRLA